MKTVQMNIPLGYKIKEQKTHLSFGQARDLLLTRKQKKYTKAYWQEDGIELTSNYIECPHCRKRIYAYAKEINKIFGHKWSPDYTLNKAVINDWITPQMTFFEKDVKEIELNRVVKINSDITCPKCKNIMHFSNQTRRFEVKHHRHKVWVRVEILDIKELFSLPCVSENEITIKFPIYEVACFNFRNGHSYLRLENSDGDCLAVRDFTYDKYKWGTGVIYDTIATNKYVRRAIKNAFVDEWGGELPFITSELGINELRLLTMFIGYDKQFYSCIPFENGTLKIDDSFKSLAQRMRMAQNVISLYKNSKLPNMKSVKKLFFDNAGLFFYLDESERLWQILKDPNYFVWLFQGRTVYQLLSDIHIRPRIIEFLEDYADAGKNPNFSKLLGLHWNVMRNYAINYTSMSEFMRKNERAKWKKYNFDTTIERLPNFAIPMRETVDKIRNCTMDGFEFSWLKTSNDYKEIGKTLNNCLASWGLRDYPVVCVRKNGEIVAAIEVRDDCVYQAYSSNNESLSKIPGLEEAYKKWIQKNKLSERRSRYEDDEYDQGLNLEELFEDYL